MPKELKMLLDSHKPTENHAEPQQSQLKTPKKIPLDSNKPTKDQVENQ